MCSYWKGKHVQRYHVQGSYYILVKTDRSYIDWLYTLYTRFTRMLLQKYILYTYNNVISYENWHPSQVWKLQRILNATNINEILTCIHALAVSTVNLHPEPETTHTTDCHYRQRRSTVSKSWWMNSYIQTGPTRNILKLSLGLSDYNNVKTLGSLQYVGEARYVQNLRNVYSSDIARNPNRYLIRL